MLDHKEVMIHLGNEILLICLPVDQPSQVNLNPHLHERLTPINDTDLGPDDVSNDERQLYQIIYWQAFMKQDSNAYSNYPFHSLCEEKDLMIMLGRMHVEALQGETQRLKVHIKSLDETIISLTFVSSITFNISFIYNGYRKFRSSTLNWRGYNTT